jgi:hypothetical protein
VRNELRLRLASGHSLYESEIEIPSERRSLSAPSDGEAVNDNFIGQVVWQELGYCRRRLTSMIFGMATEASYM